MVFEEKLRIGKKGEISTTKRIRESLGLRSNTYVLATVVKDKLIIRKIPSLSELLEGFHVEIDWEEVEKLSESMQSKITKYDERENSI